LGGEKREVETPPIKEKAAEYFVKAGSGGKGTKKNLRSSLKGGDPKDEKMRKELLSESRLVRTRSALPLGGGEKLKKTGKGGPCIKSARLEGGQGVPLRGRSRMRIT